MDKNLQNLIIKDNKQYCTICTWRASCKKKFNFFQDESVNCIEFTRDLIYISSNNTNNEQHKK